MQARERSITGSFATISTPPGSFIFPLLCDLAGVGMIERANCCVHVLAIQQAGPSRSITQEGLSQMLHAKC